jgi:hypothetical protein
MPRESQTPDTMTVFKKAVTGFNHNIKHKGKAYHVQTEDSGVNNPHIITHLFVGGNIIASKKTSYADIVNAENLAEVVRELMEEQHKEMLRNLLSGVYDTAESALHAKSWAPGQIQTDAREVKLNVGTPIATRPAPQQPAAPPPALPPEVLAAREFSGIKPKEGGETLFGEDLISEKSLDEVILAYLAGESDR